MIIDAHQHLGVCDHFLLTNKKEQVLHANKKAKIDKCLMMPFPGSPDPFKEHDNISKMGDRAGGKVFGITAINPIKYGDRRALEEIERTVKSLSFRCVKIHTIAWGLFPFSPLAMKMIEKAQELNVPVMVHTGGSLFANPVHVDAVASKFPDVKFVLAHMGWIHQAPEAIDVARRNQNVYLETSWSAGYDIRGAIDAIGEDRVMMGSDLPDNTTSEIEKIRSLGLTGSQERKVLAENAARVFRI